MTLREDRYRRERDEARTELASLREQVETLVELSDEKQKTILWLQAQLQAANAVVERLEEDDRLGIFIPDKTVEAAKAYRATQKGGAVPQNAIDDVANHIAGDAELDLPRNC